MEQPHRQVRLGEGDKRRQGIDHRVGAVFVARRQKHRQGIEDDQVQAALVLEFHNPAGELLQLAEEGRPKNGLLTVNQAR